MAPELDELVVGDPPEAWRAAGFDVAADGTCQVGTVRVRLVGRDAGKRILGWSLRGLPPGTTTIDGLATMDPEGEPGPGVDHPNGAVALDHVVVLTPDLPRTEAALAAVGIELRRRRDVPPEQYGFAAVQSFFRIGEAVLEVLGPAAGEDAPGGDGPAAFYGLAWTVRDLDAAANVLGPALGRVKDAVQPGRRIATLRHKDVGMSVATALMSQ